LQAYGLELESFEKYFVTFPLSQLIQECDATYIATVGQLSNKKSSDENVHN